jgi:hypothetical protein
MRLDPLSITARAWYINQLIYRNRLDEAEREMEKLAATAPVFYAMYRGRLDSRGGKWANGMLGYLESWQIDPTPVYARRGLSLYFAFVGLESEALAIPDVSLVRALTFLGRHADAARTAEALLADDPMSMTRCRFTAAALWGRPWPLPEITSAPGPFSRSYGIKAVDGSRGEACLISVA